MQVVPVQATTDVAAARRAVAQALENSGFGEQAAAQASLVATELATNLLKHGGGGRLLVGVDDTGVDLLALDNGAGMTDVQACLRDGYSTAGTLGQGLGAVGRASMRFELVSWPDKGTVAYARVARRANAPAHDDSIAAIVVPLAGEVACGDAWSSHDGARGRTVFVVDGLGHGTDAAIAAAAAVKQFERSAEEPPQEILQAAHQAMRSTRGGAVAVAHIDTEHNLVSYAGLGNIAGVVAGPGSALKRMVSHNGTAGHNARKIQAFDYPCGDSLLVMHSDGISGNWSFDRYPGLVRAHPMLAAGVLYRDHARGRDDALIVVSRTRR